MKILSTILIAALTALALLQRADAHTTCVVQPPGAIAAALEARGEETVAAITGDDGSPIALVMAQNEETKSATVYMRHVSGAGCVIFSIEGKKPVPKEPT